MKRDSSVQKVPKTGIYRVKKGMQVIPVARAKKMRGIKKVRKMGRSGGR